MAEDERPDRRRAGSSSSASEKAAEAGRGISGLGAPGLRRTAPPVAVAIPAHDDAPLLERLLDRLAETGARLEIIVVDDHSSDDTAAMLSARAAPPGCRLKALRNPANLGPGPSRNRAIDAAEAPLLLFIDADDLPHPDLFAWAEDARPAPPADFTLFRHHLCADAQAPFTHRMAPRDEAAWHRARAARGDLSGLCRLSEVPMLAGMIAFPWTRLFRTDFLREKTVRFPDLRLHEDVPFAWAAWARAEAFLVLDHAPPLLHHFEVHAGDRATDAADARRLDAFRALDMVITQETRLQADPELAAVFIDFALDLAAWAGGMLAGGEHAPAAAKGAQALLARLDRLAAESGADWSGRAAGLALLEARLGAPLAEAPAHA